MIDITPDNYSPKPMDIVVTTNPAQKLIGGPIRFFQKYFLSEDNEATYTHALFILDREGTTFEAGVKPEEKDGPIEKRLWWIGKQNLWNAYDGCQVRIIRHTRIEADPAHYWPYFRNVATEYDGEKYPSWRLFMFPVPPLARKLRITRLGVCSEIVSMALARAGLLPGWAGYCPDHLADFAHPVWGRKGFKVAQGANLELLEGTLRSGNV